MNTPNKLSKQIDLRDVRGASIRPSRTIPSKMDKIKDPKRQRRERIDYDESDEETDIPETLYHATYGALLDSIKEHGLGGKSSGYEWEDSKSGVVYLATDEDVAVSYAETNEDVPEEWLDDIVVLEIDTTNLNPDKLLIDSNVQDNDGSTVEYHGVIPFDSISILSYNESYSESIRWHKID